MGKNRLPPEQPKQPNDDNKVDGCLRGPDGTGAFQPPADPAAPVYSYCWSCGAQIRNVAEGISLDGSTTFHCCHKCWDRVPVTERLRLNREMRGDLAQTIQAVRGLVEMAMREYTHRPTEDMGENSN